MTGLCPNNMVGRYSRIPFRRIHKSFQTHCSKREVSVSRNPHTAMGRGSKNEGLGTTAPTFSLSFSQGFLSIVLLGPYQHYTDSQCLKTGTLQKDPKSINHQTHFCKIRHSHTESVESLIKIWRKKHMRTFCLVLVIPILVFFSRKNQ